MANINHLDMCETVKNLPVIECKKTCLGLFTKITYTPTGSKVKAMQNEYSVENGNKLAEILKSDATSIANKLKGKKIVPSSMGNMRLDACISEDHHFIAVQLLRFTDFSYEPYTDTKVYEGEAAAALAGLFQK